MATNQDPATNPLKGALLSTYQHTAEEMGQAKLCPQSPQSLQVQDPWVPLQTLELESLGA